VDLDKINVLVVEDSATMRDLIAACLKKLGLHNLSSAGNGRLALPHLARAHIVICDWDMPDIDGLQLLKIVRSEPQYEHLPFIMLTAVAGKENVSKAIQAGVTDYMAKPFQPKRFGERVIKIVNTIQTGINSNQDFTDLTDL